MRAEFIKTCDGFLVLAEPGVERLCTLEVVADIEGDIETVSHELDRMTFGFDDGTAIAAFRRLSGGVYETI